MKQYLELLKNIMDNGVEKESGRANMPNTFGISHASMSFNLADGFPLLTTKKMYLKGIIRELLWFLRGDTNIKYLVDNNVNIWNGDAYRWYLKTQGEMYEGKIEPRFTTIEYFIDFIRNNPITKISAISDFCYGDLGKVYGYQWRNQNGIDQVKEVLNGLKSNPYSRYHIIDGWNKADFNDMALPPCHLLYQFICRPMSDDVRIAYAIKNDLYNGVALEDNAPKFYLDLNMYQRSCDTFLGVPFNIASMSLLLMIFAKASNMVAGVSTWIGGDTHLYVNHKDAVNTQLERMPFALPLLQINKDISSLQDIEALKIEDFELNGYEFHPAIKAELSTGLKK